MRSLTTTAAVALALSGSVLALEHSFSKRQTSKTVTLPLFQQDEVVYLANISVGTPPQTVTVQIDTGSSDLWVFADTNQCDDQEGCNGGTFKPSSSSSYRDIGKGLFNSSYGDGSTAVGDYITETVQFGGVTINNMTMGISYQAQSELPFWGIMGIDFPAGEFIGEFGPIEYFNLPYWMTAQGLINEPVYSLYLDDITASTSNLLFGGIDTDKFNAPLTILDVVPEQSQEGDSLYSFYAVPLTAVGGIDSKGDTSSFTIPSAYASTGGIPVILDSGSSATTLPETTVADIFDQLGVTNSRQYGAIIPCSMANSDVTLAFQFGGDSGALIGVSMAEMVTSPAAVTVSGTDYCSFGISAGSEGNYILGDTFLRSAYVVFDPGNAQVGIAQAKPDVSNSADSALAATATVPASIGTLPVSLVGQGTGFGTGGIPGNTVNEAASATETGRATGRPGIITSAGGDVSPTAAATGLRGGSSIPGIATVRQTHASINAAATPSNAAAPAASTSKSVAGAISPPNLAGLFAAAGSSIVVLVAGLGGAAVIFSGL